MRLSKKTIKEFKKIYREEFGEAITNKEACEKFLRLINLLRTILKEPNKGQDLNSPDPSSFDEHSKNVKLKE